MAGFCHWSICGRELKNGEPAGANEKREQEAINIVVLQADGRQFGLMVDKINDTQEIVVKPLEKQLKIKTFAGASIMGDGKIAPHSGRNGAGAKGERGKRSTRSRIRRNVFWSGDHGEGQTDLLAVHWARQCSYGRAA